MPYYDAEGNEVEGLLTQEELDAKLEEERQKLNSEFEEKNNATQQKIGELEAAQKAAQAAVDAAEKAKAGGEGGGDGGGDKDQNLAALRTKLDETNAALEAEREANKQRFERENSERVNTAISSVVGEDKELAEKVRHHFETTLSAVKAETPEEIRQKVASAMKLSVDVETGPNPLDTARQSGGFQPVTPAGDGKKAFTPKQVEQGKYFGISDADRAKYGNDPRLKK